jgi:hypothetical protein
MKTIVIEATPCPSCGKPMPAGALAGLCPGCLLAQGIGTDAGEGYKGAGFVPPQIAEIAKLFPQLEIISLLGAGGMGAVYKARQPALDRFVALKILPASGAQGANFEERFNREARALARLSHPNIVAVHEFGKADSLHFFIMEFVDGANLRQLEQAGRLAPREALQIIPQICDALQYAHDEGVVHRDIKPENVLVDRKGRVKIADFGLAKILGQEADAFRLTAEGQVMGTPHYMAPEQVERPLSVDHRADIYALGVVFYEMLTGDLPLGKFSPPSLKVQVDVRLDDVVLRALENDPERRYQNASEVKSQVETIVGTPPPAASTAAAPVPDEQYVRWIGSNVIVEREGQRRVNPAGTFKAFGLIFGALTLAFLLVSLITGRTHFGFLGISGALSLQVRLLIAIILTAWGVWRVWRRPAGTAQRRTPQGMVVFARPGVSRKAIVGVTWAPLFFIAALLMFTTASVITHGPAADGPAPSMNWWQMILSATVLPLGVAAPFGTTILGWLAVGEIRRSNGRVTGLPLAVFDGLLFPLLALDALILLALPTAAQAVAEANGNVGFTGPWPAIARIGAVLICLIADFEITRRVWRAVKGGALSKPPSAARRMAMGFSGAAAVVMGLVAVNLVMNRMENRTGKVPARHQVAQFDEKSGALMVQLPRRGTVSLLAVADSGAAANAWWRPDGTAIPDTIFDVRAQSDQLNAGFKNRDFIVRWKDLPSGAGGPWLRVEPAAGGSASGGGTVSRDGKELSNAWLVRGSFPNSTTRATLWLGFGLDAWQTIGSYAGDGQSSQMRAASDWRRKQQRGGDLAAGTRATGLESASRGRGSERQKALGVQRRQHTDRNQGTLDVSFQIAARAGARIPGAGAARALGRIPRRAD